MPERSAMLPRWGNPVLVVPYNIVHGGRGLINKAAYCVNQFTQIMGRNVGGYPNGYADSGSVHQKAWQRREEREIAELLLIRGQIYRILVDILSNSSEILVRRYSVYR